MICGVSLPSSSPRAAPINPKTKMPYHNRQLSTSRGVSPSAVLNILATRDSKSLKGRLSPVIQQEVTSKRGRRSEAWKCQEGKRETKSFLASKLKVRRAYAYLYVGVPTLQSHSNPHHDSALHSAFGLGVSVSTPPPISIWTLMETLQIDWRSLHCHRTVRVGHGVRLKMLRKKRAKTLIESKRRRLGKAIISAPATKNCNHCDRCQRLDWPLTRRY